MSAASTYDQGDPHGPTPSVVPISMDHLLVRDTDMQVKLIGTRTLVHLLAAEDRRIANQSLAQDAFDRFAARLTAWALDERQHIVAAFLGLHGPTLAFVVIQRAEEYDLPLMDRLAGLEMSLRDERLIPCGLPFEGSLLPRMSASNLASFIGASVQPVGI